MNIRYPHGSIFTVSSLLFVFILVFSLPMVQGLSVAPNFTLTDVDGSVFSLSDFRGQVVLLEFMQTWCSKCQSEARELNTVHNELGNNITMISISIWYQDTDDVLRSYRDYYGNDWIYARDTINLKDMYNVADTPTVYIIDHDGNIRFSHSGVTEASILINEIREILPFPLTITTVPALDNIRFQVDGRDYYTPSNGSFVVNLETGQHQVTLIDTLIAGDGGLEYRFSGWSGVYAGSNNPVDITMTSASLLFANFETYDVAPPLADAGHNQTIYRNSTITFDGSQSYDNIGILTYEWTFIDGTPQTLFGDIATYRFVTSGIYMVTLNVSDAAGNWATDTIVITVVNKSQPIVNAGPDQIVDEDTWVTFNGSASWDPEGHATYTWTFIDETPQTLLGRMPTYRFTDPGLYVVTLVMTDPEGTRVSDTVQITVRDLTPPIAYAGPDQIIDIGMPMTVSAENSTDNGEIIQYNWDFGDGTEKTGVTSDHIYTEAGTYTVVLTVKDVADNVDTDQFTVTVRPREEYQKVFSITDPYNQTTQIIIESNTAISAFSYDERSITYRVDGSPGTVGYCNITIPLTILGTQYNIFVDNSPITPIEARNSTHAFLYFEHLLSRHEIKIVGSSSAPGIVNLSGLSLIFSAGVLALLSPCGFPMLPGYISYYLGRKASVERTVIGGVVCTFGLIAVFTVIGAAVAVVGSLISQYIPLLELGAGILSIMMGLSMIMDIKFPTFLTIAKAPSQKGVLGIFLYGIAYGLAILGCSAPIFFSTLFYAVASGGVLHGVLTFLVYALGMGLPLIVITILVAKAKQLMIDRIMHWMPRFQKIGSLILISIGIYLIYYYLT